MEELFLKKYENEISAFEDWIRCNSELPQNINRLLLLRYLKVYEFDLEQAKKLLLFNLETRHKNPDLFFNRVDIENVFDYAQVFEPANRTPDNYKVSFFRMTKPECFDMCDFMRLCTAALDVKLMICTDDTPTLHDGEIFVNDVHNFGFSCLIQCVKNFKMLSTYIKYAQDAAPIRMKQNHFVHCSSTVSKLFKLIKPVLKKEVSDSFFFHSSIESLHEFVPKECLPEEFGGNVGKFEESWLDWMKYWRQKRDYVCNNENWRFRV